ncbi:MAG: hypothetical protein JWO67_5235, partial [Streptosporangiaceae bacterium]|nr:hypothetical protein [Streptosporangiaceae bacterium]
MNSQLRRYDAVMMASVRPARAVYLIGEASEAGFRRAVQEASTRWAGACEPIVEVRADGAISADQRSIIDLSAPDGAVNIDADRESALTTATSLGLELVQSVDHIDVGGITSLSAHPGELGLPATIDGTNGYVIARAGGDLWEATAAGDLTDLAQEQPGPETIKVTRPRWHPDLVARAHLRGATLIDQTVAHFAENSASGGAGDGPTVVWATSGTGDLADCLGFWNMRVLRPLRFGTVPMYLLPADQLKDWVGFRDEFARQLARPIEVTPDVLLTSATLDGDALHEVAKELGLELAEKRSVSIRRSFPPTGKVRSVPFTFLQVRSVAGLCDFTRTYGAAVPVDVPEVRDQVVLRFSNPAPGTTGQFVLATITSELLASYPHTESVARLFHRNGSWRNGGLQIPVRAEPEFRLPLAVPSLAKAVGTLLDERTIRWQTSEKGAIGASLTDDEIALQVLGEPHVLESIGKLTTPRGKRMAQELAKLLGKDRPLSESEAEFAARWGGRTERTIKTPAHLGHGAPRAAAGVLERLAGIGWAERGLEIKCTACGINSFLPMSTVSERGVPRCPGCHTLGAYTGNDGPTTAYRLDSRIDRASDQGVLPHLLTIAALSRTAQASWFLPGVDLWFAADREKADSEKKEADILGIADGKLITGEVKTSGQQFTIAQIGKDIAIATRLEADIYVMAAATSPIPDEAQKNAQQLCEKNGLE